MEGDYHLIEREPDPDVYVELRARCGLTPRTREAAERALGHALYAVCVQTTDGRTIAMGRVLGDRSWYVIVDVAVHPDHQRRGIGRTISRALVDFIERDAPPGAQAFLLADGPARHLYAEFGFRDPAPASVAMVRRLGDAHD